MLRDLLPLIIEDADLQLLKTKLTEPELRVVCDRGIEPLVLNQLIDSHLNVVLTPTSEHAEELQSELLEYLPPEAVAVFPAWETMPHERLSPRSDTIARRIQVLRRIVKERDTKLKVLLLPLRAALQPVAEYLPDLNPIELTVGRDISMDALTKQLNAYSYNRVDIVESRGQFAIRGGIIDIFAPSEAHPVRIEFWGETIDQIRSFSAADQRSFDAEIKRIEFFPCKEILFDEALFAKANELLPKFPNLADLLEKIANGIAVEGIESLTSLFVADMVNVMHFLPDGSRICCLEVENLERRAADLITTSEEFLQATWSVVADGGQTPIDISQAGYQTLTLVREYAKHLGHRWWEFSRLPSGNENFEVIFKNVTSFQNSRKDLPQALPRIKQFLSQDYVVALCAKNQTVANQLVDQFISAGIAAKAINSKLEPQTRSVVQVFQGHLSNGFVIDSVKCAVILDKEVTGRRSSGTKDMQAMPSRRRNAVDPLLLKAGDYVVHEKHGVGKFVELITRSIPTGKTVAKREYLVLEYASTKRGQPGDRLFVPMDQLDQLTRYIGGDSPPLSKMGGSDWAKTKSKARKAVREIAGELIRLYSARSTAKGYSFSPDTPWQRELEQSFEFVETPDQLSTIDDVKADMEKSTPMDRLICGDVGYGKTEIAVRAAFKAVQDGKQVVVLVPTTLLVQQHLETFSERYAGFPVTVKGLSRFQTKKESDAILAELKVGKLDVVIGTHRLLTGQVQFKDLGLVIVDEEQRFGVEHKETLKQFRTNVDVLSMSATPIPRTLEMAVTGIREMSTLATPPEERHPVLTYVGRQENKQVAAAIHREMLRGGQTFYIHNRVEDIDKTAQDLQELVPNARIGVAHGRMHEKQLEEVIMGFWEKEYDVLVCTTIIETGIDVSNANTLILERADRFGLSQLHQLRGRVGRGKQRAYAYFLYPKDTTLTEQAHERLSTIAQNSDLGSGMQVAMKDLELRGAGNLLGGEQSGHIAGVGFDLYIRMVGEAVSALKGDYEAPVQELSIELPIDAHIPTDYVAQDQLRLEAYKKIAAAKDDAALGEVAAELVDRYGKYPESVELLFAVARFRNRVGSYGLSDISVQGKYIRFTPLSLAESQQLRIKRIYPGTQIKPAVRTALVPYPTTAKIGGDGLTGQELIDWLNLFVETIVVPIA